MSIHSVRLCDLNIIKDKLQVNVTFLAWDMMGDLLKSYEVTREGNLHVCIISSSKLCVFISGSLRRKQQ